MIDILNTGADVITTEFISKTLSGIRAVVTHFQSVYPGQPSALLLGQQALASGHWVTNAPQPVWFLVMVAAGWWLATGAPLKEPQSSLSRNTVYDSSVLGYLPTFLSVAIRTREHPGSWAAQCPTFRESCLDHWHTELLPAVPGEVDELPRVTFHFQLVFMEVEVLHWQLFRLNSAWLGTCPTCRMILFSK